MFEVTLRDGAADRLRRTLLALSPGADVKSTRMFDGIVVEVSPGEIALTLLKRLPERLIVLALLRIRPPRSNFTVIHCRSPAAFVFPLPELIRRLIPASGDDEAVLTIDGCHDYIPEETVAFHTRKSASGTRAFSLILVSDYEKPEWMIPTNDYEFRTIIKIPAEDFKRLIIKLNDFADDVSVRATRTEVKFSAANEEVILRTKPGANLDTADCIIEYFQDADEVSFSFSLRHREMIINTCELTESVRLLHSDGLKPMLSCVVGGLGKMVLFFDWPPR